MRVEDPAAAVTTLAGFGRPPGSSTLESSGSRARQGRPRRRISRPLRSRDSRHVHASPLSFNNEVGVPLTLLGAEPGTDVVVAEMGARFEGNIADICAIARPDVGVVTHIGMAHAEHLGGPAGIARVKGELMEALPTSGLAVLNDDDAETLGDGGARRRGSSGSAARRGLTSWSSRWSSTPSCARASGSITPWGTPTRG